MIRIMTFAGLALLVAVPLAGCAHGVNGCDGWSPQRPKAATVDYIYENDPEFADSVLIHNMHGESRCGWKAG